MNKESLQSVYCLDRPVVSYMADFCQRYPELMDSAPIEPEFQVSHSHQNPNSRIDEVSDNTSSINNTVSFCSNFSRVPMDKVLFRDILRKRKDHKIFLELEPEEFHDERRWYYIDDKDSSIIGPLTPKDMNQRFELDVFKETTKMKKKFEEEYYALSVLVKRYLKNVLNEKLDLQKAQNPLSNKITKFKKGETLAKNGKEKEVFEHKNRDERFFSQAVRPNLLDLKRMMPSDPDAVDNEYARLRANTYSQRFNQS